MCHKCWERYGSPKITNYRVIKAVVCIGLLYELCPVGARLHIVTDDYNVSDGDLGYCIKRIEDDPEFWKEDNWDGEGSCISGEEQYIIEMNCANALVDLTEEERMSAIALYWEDWKLEEL